jgi:hypothetical protein
MFWGSFGGRGCPTGGPHLDSEMWETINPNSPLSISDAWNTTNLNPDH